MTWVARGVKKGEMVTIIAAWDATTERVWINGKLRFLRIKRRGSRA